MEPLNRDYTSNSEIIPRLIDRVNELTEICNEWRKPPVEEDVEKDTENQLGDML